MNIDRIAATARLADAGTQTAVQAESGQSIADMLSDAREELSFFMEGKTSGKSLTELVIHTELPARVMGIEEINKYLDQAGFDPSRLAEIIRRLQQSARPLDTARSESRVPAHQFVWLQLALGDAAQGRAAADVVARLQAALAELYDTQKAQVLAGLNTVEVAAKLQPDSAAIDNQLLTYSDVVLGEGDNLGKTLLLILQRLSGAQGQDFARGLDALLQSLGAEMVADQPSIDKTRLQMLMQDIYQLEVVSSMLEDCGKLAQAIVRHQADGGVVPLELMNELVVLVGERWVMPDRFFGLERKFQLQMLAARIAFQMGLKGLLRKIPVKVFIDESARDTLFEAHQSVLDKTVAEEEDAAP